MGQEETLFGKIAEFSLLERNPKFLLDFRSALVWGVNVILVLWYALGHVNVISLNLRSRLAFFWPITAILNILREQYAIPDYRRDRNLLLIDLFCNTQCYGVGLWLLDTNEKENFTAGAILMFSFSLTLFLYACYRRFSYSDTIFHRYAISWELFVSVLVLPMFLFDDLIVDSRQQEWFIPYLITDVVLKATRTYALLKHADTWKPVQRLDSWNEAISNESFLDYFTLDAPQKVGAELESESSSSFKSPSFSMGYSGYLRTKSA